MESDRQAFLAAIAARPWDDELTHLVYADWLDERGEHEEADRQRKYVPAVKVLMRYADTDWRYRQPGYKEQYVEKYGQEEWDECRLNDLKPYGLEQLMTEIEWWKEGVLGGSRYGGGKPWIGFGSNFAQDELHDPKKRAEFWAAFEVVTGIKAPEDLREQDYYHCAC